MFESIASWLIGAESRPNGLDVVMSELGRRLLEAGLPIWRMHASVLAMHPEVFSRSVRWHRENGVTVRVNRMELLHDPDYVGSPIEAIHKGHDHVFARVEEGEFPYRPLKQLREEGGTGYAAFALVLGEGRRSFISLSSDKPGGFSDAQLAAFQALLPALTIRLELESTRFSSETLLELYLGRNAASRVLAGDFRRGTGQVIHAAIWLCDLRGFTSLADRLPLTEVVPILDAYFEAMAAPIQRAGGEILKFIGDSILAVFPTGRDTDAAGACRRAVSTATESLDAFAAVPSASANGLKAGVAVNLGEVMYGNIGAPDRLDFTVIGPAVNETARMESMCKELATPLLFSEAVARHIDDKTPVGTHALRGVSEKRALYTLKRFAPA